MPWTRQVFVILLLVIASCSSSESSQEADDLIGTWDYPLDQTQAQLVVDDFSGLVDSAESVVIRLGFDGSEFWQGFLFDGELFLLEGVPEGDGGPYDIDGDRIITTGAHGEVRATFTWNVDGDELRLVWVEQCSLSSQSEDCTSDRSQLESQDPFTLMVWEHTFTSSGDNPTY